MCTAYCNHAPKCCFGCCGRQHVLAWFAATFLIACVSGASAVGGSGGSESVGSNAAKHVKKAHVESFADFVAKVRGVVTGDFDHDQVPASAGRTFKFSKDALVEGAKKMRSNSQVGGTHSTAAASSVKLKNFGFRRLDSAATRGSAGPAQRRMTHDTNAIAALYNAVPEAGGLCFYWREEGPMDIDQLFEDSMTAEVQTVGPIDYMQTVYGNARAGVVIWGYRTTQTGACPPPPPLTQVAMLDSSFHGNIFGIGPTESGGVGMRRLDSFADPLMRQWQRHEGSMPEEASATSDSLPEWGYPENSSVLILRHFAQGVGECKVYEGPSSDPKNYLGKVGIGDMLGAIISADKVPFLGPETAITFACGKAQANMGEPLGIGWGGLLPASDGCADDDQMVKALELGRSCSGMISSCSDKDVGPLVQLACPRTCSVDCTYYKSDKDEELVAWAAESAPFLNSTGCEEILPFMCEAQSELAVSFALRFFCPSKCKDNQTDWQWRDFTAACFDDSASMRVASYDFGGRGECSERMCSDELYGPAARHLCSQTCGTCVRSEGTCVNQDAAVAAWSAALLNDTGLTGCEDPFIEEGGLCFGGADMPPLVTHTIRELCPETCLTCGVRKTCETRTEPDCQYEGAPCSLGYCYFIQGQDKMVCSSCPSEVVAEMTDARSGAGVCQDDAMCEAYDSSKCEYVFFWAYCPKLCGVCTDEDKCENKDKLLADSMEKVLELLSTDFSLATFTCEDLTPDDCLAAGSLVLSVLCPVQCSPECQVEDDLGPTINGTLFTWTGDLRTWLCPNSAAVFNLVGDKEQMGYPVQSLIVSGDEACQFSRKGDPSPSPTPSPPPPAPEDITDAEESLTDTQTETTTAATALTTTETTTTMTSTTTRFVATKFDVSFKVTDMSKITEEALIASIAASSNSEEDEVTIEGITTSITLGYSFDASIQEDQVKAVVAEASQVSSDAVSITKVEGRRLAPAGSSSKLPRRRLAGVEYEATITTDDLEQAPLIMQSAQDATSLQDAILQVAPGAPVPEVTQAPTAELTVRTSVRSRDGSVREAPEEIKVEAYFRSELGVEVQVQVDNVRIVDSAEEMDTTTFDDDTTGPGDADPDDTQLPVPSVSGAGRLGSCLQLVAAVATTAGLRAATLSG